MTILKATLSLNRPGIVVRFIPSLRNLELSLSHWGWAVPILLAVALLAISAIDDYPPSRDEFFSMQTAGWLFGGPYSPADVLENINTFRPDHMPGYFNLLSLWGRLTGWQVELGRILSIFFGLMSLAVTFRLARDFVAPAAGAPALILVSSSAMYNFYFSYLRMYTLLPFVAGVILWVYLRILYRQRRARPADYVLLGISAFILINIHALTAAFLLMLGVFHLVVAPKNRRWLLVSAAVCAGVLIVAPTLLQKGAAAHVIADVRAVKHSDAASALIAWLHIATNNQPALLLLPLLGALVAIRKRAYALLRFWALAVIYLLLIAAMAELTTWVNVGTMRYHLAAWPPFALAIAAGLYSLSRAKKQLYALPLLWVLAGAGFQASGDLSTYVFLPGLSTNMPPTQVITRLARNAETTPALLGYGVSEFYRGLLEYRGQHYWPRFIDYSQADHYFERHDIPILVANDLLALEEEARRLAVRQPTVWLFHQKSHTSATLDAQVASLFGGLHYEVCGRIEVGRDTVIVKYMWDLLDCQPLQPALQRQNEMIDYQFYRAAAGAERRRLYFVDQWQATGDFSAGEYNLSYQLLTANWENVAQLDLPLADSDEPRRYYVDVANVEPGSYRLMLILYHAQTGERRPWEDNAGSAPGMLQLSEIELR